MHITAFLFNLNASSYSTLFTYPISEFFVFLSREFLVIELIEKDYIFIIFFDI